MCRYSVGVLVVSDTVCAAKKMDTSGEKVTNLLKSGKYFEVSSVTQDCVPDDISAIREVLLTWVDKENIDLILTVGGTGFSARDVTPEATKSVIDKEAPHLASRMVLGCCEKTEFAVLSRSVCGVRGQSLILNLPGSAKGAVECFEMIARVLPHALDQVKSRTESVATLHVKISGPDERTLEKPS